MIENEVKNGAFRLIHANAPFADICSCRPVLTADPSRCWQQDREASNAVVSDELAVVVAHCSNPGNGGKPRWGCGLPSPPTEISTQQLPVEGIKHYHCTSLLGTCISFLLDWLSVPPKRRFTYGLQSVISQMVTTPTPVRVSFWMSVIKFRTHYRPQVKLIY